MLDSHRPSLYLAETARCFSGAEMTDQNSSRQKDVFLRTCSAPVVPGMLGAGNPVSSEVSVLDDPASLEGVLVEATLGHAHFI